MAYAYETKEYRELQRKYRQLQESYKALEKRPSREALLKMKNYAEMMSEKADKYQSLAEELQKWKKYPSDETKAIIRKLEEENEKMKQVLKDIATSAAPFKASMDNLKI